MACDLRQAFMYGYVCAARRSPNGNTPYSTATAANARDSQNATVPLIIGGKDVITKALFPKVGPIENKEIWQVAGSSPEDANAAAAAAERAFPAWSATKPSKRRDVFLMAADVMERRRAELADIIRQELGANEHFQNFMLDVTIEGLRDTAGRIAGACTGTLPSSEHDGMRAMVQKRPYGVILGIAPWNAPFHLGARSISFGLAAGNTAVFKGSELSPRCHWALADVFREARLPDGCLNLVFHKPEDAVLVTKTLIAHPAIKHINFTGSTQVGSAISVEAAKHLKPVLMELGGKANAIVLKDADLENAAMQCAMGAFLNAGQICMSTERILVHEDLVESFLDILKSKIQTLFGSVDNTPILVTEASAARNRELVEDAISKGAEKVIWSSEDGEHEAVPTHMRPVLLRGVDETMKLYRGESFGPTVSLYAFSDEDAMIKMANDTDYGLTCGIFTENLGTALRVADQIESGAVHINSMTVHDEFPLPHGGVKKSGFGRFNGYQGMDEFTYTKSITWMHQTRTT
ncbi:aldehyde dehydrogenase [Microdochium bolleyi]|uniref:Aldehyde dehydrogenase n=1 Tax=Microdochium bolleyi TaxID=196109 RepID=A0A136IT64_9PEZI|nr:aldehyde dehydrogenase [Microdochium bolleyi]